MHSTYVAVDKEITEAVVTIHRTTECDRGVRGINFYVIIQHSSRDHKGLHFLTRNINLTLYSLAIVIW